MARAHPYHWHLSVALVLAEVYSPQVVSHDADWAVALPFHIHKSEVVGNPNHIVGRLVDLVYPLLPRHRLRKLDLAVAHHCIVGRHIAGCYFHCRNHLVVVGDFAAHIDRLEVADSVVVVEVGACLWVGEKSLRSLGSV